LSFRRTLILFLSAPLICYLVFAKEKNLKKGVKERVKEKKEEKKEAKRSGKGLCYGF
jgi:hypothetical protein